MTGNAPQDRDKLPITGIPPVADPLPETQGEQHEAQPETPAQTKAVFVDATGWRARLGRRFGLATGAVLAVFLGALGLGMATGPSVPLTSWSEPSPRPRVKPSRPDVPSGKPRERRAAEGQGPEPSGQAAANPEAGRRGAASAPSTPEPTTPLATPTPAPATSHPGNGRSQADPPAWGRKKKDR